MVLFVTYAVYIIGVVRYFYCSYLCFDVFNFFAELNPYEGPGSLGVNGIGYVDPGEL